MANKPYKQIRAIWGKDIDLDKEAQSAKGFRTTSEGVSNGLKRILKKIECHGK